MIALSAADLDTVVRTVIGEADDQGADGEAGISWAILNRATWDEQLAPDHPEHEWWGTSPAKVCAHPYQFTCWGGGKNTDRIKAIAVTDPDYLRVQTIVQAVFAGDVPDPTGGATTYKVRGTAASWDKSVEEIPPRSIGAHDFWRLGPNGVCYEPQGLGGTDGATGSDFGHSRA